MADTELEMLSKMDRNPAQESRYRELLAQQSLPYFPGGNRSTTEQFRVFAAGAGGIPGASVDPAQDVTSLARQMVQFQRKAAQPAIASLQAQIPEIQQRFAAQRTQIEAEKEPLKQRYQNLLAEIKGREQTDITAAQRRLGQEFGYRGIPASSTLYLDELARAEQPIRQAYAGRTGEIGLTQEEDLRQLANLQAGLTGQETEALRGIQSSIGQLQAGEPTSALQAALQLLGLRQQEQESAATRTQQLRIAQLEQEGKRYISPEEQGLKQAQTGYYLREAGQPYATKGPTEAQTVAQSKNQLLTQARQGATLGNLVHQFGGALPLADVVKLYTAVTPHGPPVEDWAKEILGKNKPGIINPY